MTPARPGREQAREAPGRAPATPASRALLALLDPDPSRPILIAEAAAPFVQIPGETLPEAALARRLREADATVVVAHTLGPALARALRERPPALLVLTGPADADSIPNVPGTCLLGPEARLRIADGPASAKGLIVCATAAAELTGLLAALDLSPETAGRTRDAADAHLPRETAGASQPRNPADTKLAQESSPAGLSRETAAGRTRDAVDAHLSRETADTNLSLKPASLPPRVRLAACPTPPWWPQWLADPRLRGATALGFVAAACLDTGWARWARDAGDAPHVLVPLGLETPRVDQPRHASLAAGVAAHALERWTGPVFPSPQVLVLLGADADPSPSRPVDDPAALARWNQARRALPLVGATPGMEAPLPALALDSPSAAFITQRALLRRSRSRALLRERAGEAPDLRLDPAAIARAGEVLRSAGQVLSEHESKVVLRGFGVEITRQAVASSASGAAQFAETIGFPVVLKALSPDLRRKQELGAVMLGLTNGAAVRRAYATIVQNVEHNAPTAHLDGVLVAEQAPDGLEIHCGAVRLHTGEMAIFGRALGLPLLPEVTLALSPLDHADALLLAHAVLARVPVPALRRASDPGVGELASLLLRIDALVRHFELSPEPGDEDARPGRRDLHGSPGDGRLISVELSPIRLVGPPRGYLTLDARIVQRAHLEGL